MHQNMRPFLSIAASKTTVNSHTYNATTTIEIYTFNGNNINIMYMTQYIQ